MMWKAKRRHAFSIIVHALNSRISFSIAAEIPLSFYAEDLFVNDEVIGPGWVQQGEQRPARDHDGLHEGSGARWEARTPSPYNASYTKISDCGFCKILM
jgi:hypothetical protein